MKGLWLPKKPSLILPPAFDERAYEKYASKLAGRTQSARIKGSNIGGPDKAPSGSTAVLTYQGSAVSTTDAASYSFTTQPFGTETADRIVIAAITVARDTDSDILPSAVTIGGVSASLGRQANAGGGFRANTSIWYANVPTGTTGTVAATLPGNAEQCGLILWSMTGHNSSTPVTSAGATGTTTGPYTLSLNVSPGDVVVAAAMCNDGTNRTFTWVGLTERVDQVVETGDATHSGADATLVATETPRTITVAPSGTPDKFSCVSVSWN